MVGDPGVVDVGGELQLERRAVKALTGNGILGDPTAATAELGEEILAHLEQYLLDATAAASKERA
jgi:creatinine amidohydrolase/Fe(II)-dependent formamide hydrolase-like protein